MNYILVTGSAGLIGSESVKKFISEGYNVIGIDNNLRKYFFGEDGSVQHNINKIKTMDNYHHYDVDIRDYSELEIIFKKYGDTIKCIIHTAAQPSHDWAAKEPFVDFNVNTTGTLNLLELTRKFCPESIFIFTSTNKVYGDRPNTLPLIENETRFELPKDHQYFEGIDEQMSIDQSKHSLFGCSKVSADLYVQEYGKYFNMKTVVFRGGCLTGSKHSGAELHGFLNYLVKCNVNEKQYNIFGYKGKQVRDNIHTEDVVSAFYEVFKNYNSENGTVYNIGGGRYSNCSMAEAILKIEKISGIKMITNYVENNRIGDHIWWISDMSKFRRDYPSWSQKYDIDMILSEIYESLTVSQSNT